MEKRKKALRDYLAAMSQGLERLLLTVTYCAFYVCMPTCVIDIRMGSTVYACRLLVKDMLVRTRC